MFVINRLLDNDNMKIYYQKPVVLYEDYESFHEYNIPKVLTDIILAYKEDYHPLHKHYAKDFIYALHHNIYDIYRRLYQNRIKPSKS